MHIRLEWIELRNGALALRGTVWETCEGKHGGTYDQIADIAESDSPRKVRAYLRRNFPSLQIPRAPRRPHNSLRTALRRRAVQESI